MFGQRAHEGKYLALQRVVARRDLNELTLWNMLLCSMLVRVGLLEWKQEGWYWLHPVVAAYARVFLAGDEKQELQAG